MTFPTLQFSIDLPKNRSSGSQVPFIGLNHIFNKYLPVLIEKVDMKLSGWNGAGVAY
jgi:hypothetical protein